MALVNRLQRSLTLSDALALYDRIRFNFDQPVWIDETHNLHDCVRRANAAKEFSMNDGDLLPIFYPR